MVDVAGIANKSLSILILVLFIVIIGGLMIAVTWWYLYKYKRYSQFKCIIWEEDGFGQMTEKTDKAGIFVDNKTKNKRFFLKKADVGLQPDNVPYIMHGKERVVYLLQHGLKNFSYVKIKPKSIEGTLIVTEEDVNWGLNAYERGQKMFAQSMLMQLMPYIAIAFVSIIILVIFIYFFKGFGDLKLMAEALRDLSVNAKQMQSGTTVITGGG
jgi:uncharacterized membrane protein YqiK